MMSNIFIATAAGELCGHLFYEHHTSTPVEVLGYVSISFPVFASRIDLVLSLLARFQKPRNGYLSV
jgi:hypothetical protein